MAVKKSKRKISAVKRSNQRRTKLVKQGKLKLKRNRRASDITRNPRKQKQKPVVQHEAAEDSGGEDDMAGMVDADDLDFLKRAVTERSYSMLKRLRYTQPKSEVDLEEPPARKRKGPVQDPEDLEEQFEHHLGVTRAEQKPTRELLPVKTADGQVQRRTVTFNLPEIKSEEPSESGDPEEDEEGELQEDSEPEEDSRLDLSQPVSVAQMLAARQKQLDRFRVSIGALSSGVLEDPKGKIGNLKKLLALMGEPQPAEVALTIPRLAAVSLLEVFRDLLPEYPIRENMDEDGVKLRKETRELRAEEQILLTGYRKYLAFLEKMLQPLTRRQNTTHKGSQGGTPRERLALVALRCLGGMLESRPSFNYSHNIVRLLVPVLDHRRCAEARDIASKSLAAVLKQDKRGDISLEIARRVNALVKARATSVRPDPVRLLLHLKLKDVNLDAAKEVEMKSKQLEARKNKMLFSKRERKRAKRMKDLDREMLETKAEESKQTRQRNFTETTKLAFTVFFRVLKSEPRPALLAATLEGLAKFAHCINIEVYGDLVRVLENLLDVPELPLRHKLLCVRTLLSVISGHGQFLTIDPARFHAHLYRCLLPICSGSSQAELGDTLSSLHSVLCARRGSVSHNRLLAFSKRLCSVAMHQVHHGALACLQLVRAALQLSRGVDVLLDVDCNAGRYLPELEEPEHCGAASTSLFELATLQRHYHPTVVHLARHTALGAPITDDALPPVLRNTTEMTLYTEFDPAEVKFNPAVPSPPQQQPRRLHFSAQTLHDPDLRTKAENILETEPHKSLDFWRELRKA